MSSIQQYIDLHSVDIDPEMLTAVLAVQHISVLIANGGSNFGRPDLESALHSQQLEIFLARAVKTTQKTKRFEQEWKRLQRLLPGVKLAWVKGQAFFQDDLTRATTNPKQSKYRSLVHFALNC